MTDSDTNSLDGLSTSSFEDEVSPEEEEEEEEEEGEEEIELREGDEDDDEDLRRRRRRHMAGDGGEQLLEICVESLVGTVFEMRLSKKETISNIKMRLMRLEGIPKHHMHLLYRGIIKYDKKKVADFPPQNGSQRVQKIWFKQHKGMQGDQISGQ